MLVIPPQVNKYYALDLSHGRSMFEYLLQHGIQVFTISWRNPTGAQRDWNFDTYAQAVIEAIDVISQVSGSPDVNVMGGCLGGMTAAVAQAHLAALGERRINSATMTVTMLDCHSDGRMFLFASPATLALAKAVSKPRGVIEGWQTRADVLLAAPQRPGVELLGEQLPARPGPAGLRHPGLERGPDQAELGLPSPDTRHGRG